MQGLYKVIYSGEVRDGFNFIQVEENFAKLFKITPEKASTYLVPERVIKEGLSEDVAQMYKNKLEYIGLTVRIEGERQSLDVDSLVLESMDEPYNNIFSNTQSSQIKQDEFTSKENQTKDSLQTVKKTPFEPSKGIDIPSQKSEKNVECPKCHLIQYESARCSNCGYDILNQSQPIAYQAYIQPEDLKTTKQVQIKKSNKLNWVMFIVCLAGILAGLLFYLNIIKL